MIVLTKLNNEAFYLNPNHIETLEETPDTVITLSNGKKFIARESAQEIINKLTQYYHMIYSSLPRIQERE